MELNVHRNHKAYQGRREVGNGVWRLEKGEIMYLSLQCHHQNDSCIKMGTYENHFNASLTEGQSHKDCLQTTTFEERGEPKRNRTGVLLLTSLTPHR